MEEALWFSARLRLAKDINNQAMWAFIHEVRPCWTFMPSWGPLVRDLQHFQIT